MSHGHCIHRERQGGDPFLSPRLSCVAASLADVFPSQCKGRKPCLDPIATAFPFLFGEGGLSGERGGGEEPPLGVEVCVRGCLARYAHLHRCASSPSPPRLNFISRQTFCPGKRNKSEALPSRSCHPFYFEPTHDKPNPRSRCPVASSSHLPETRSLQPQTMNLKSSTLNP